MLELADNNMLFMFPEVDARAKCPIGFQRTLRIPDDNNVYPLPPGLGLFPVRHVDDYAARAPEKWVKHGGVVLPMYQSEAMWLTFQRTGPWPFAIKIAAGKINALTGEEWVEGLNRDPQDYLVVPEQPWLDGFCIERGIIRQFIAMPLGAGYSAEEQITGKAEHGGLQVVAYPMKKSAYERRFGAAMRAKSSRPLLGAAPQAAASSIPVYDLE